MELRHLRLFLAVAEARHFGRAARRLHLSQPTVSQQVRQLEEELGEVLFERHERGARLTPAGDLFRAYASRALEEVEAGRQALGALRGLQVGELRVGYLPSLGAGLVVPALAAVLRKHPGLRVQAYEGVSRRIERRVAEGKLDVGLGIAPSRAPEVEAEPVLEGRLSLIVPAGHALAAAPGAGDAARLSLAAGDEGEQPRGASRRAGGGRVPLRRLVEQPLALLSVGLRGRAMVDAFFNQARFSPRLVFEANAVAAVLAVVRAGLALTVLPLPEAFSQPDAGASAGLPSPLVALALSPSPPSHFTALFWRRGAVRKGAALAFAAEVRALGAAPLLGDGAAE